MRPISILARGLGASTRRVGRARPARPADISEFRTIAPDATPASAFEALCRLDLTDSNGWAAFDTVVSTVVKRTLARATAYAEGSAGGGADRLSDARTVSILGRRAGSSAGRAGDF
jgi:hypothetical protein